MRNEFRHSSACMRLRWLGFATGAGYWLLESVLHTFVFHSGTLRQTLFCESDSNELWMRIIIVLLFTGFGFLAGRELAVERHLRAEGREINRLRHIVDEVQISVSGARVKADTEDLTALYQALDELPAMLETRFRELHAILE